MSDLEGKKYNSKSVMNNNENLNIFAPPHLQVPNTTKQYFTGAAGGLGPPLCCRLNIN